nr:NF038122 family metalloprotease [Arthrospira sp. PLM2.Bin9]
MTETPSTINLVIQVKTMFSKPVTMLTQNIPLHILGAASTLLVTAPAQAATFNFFHDYGTPQKISDAFVSAGNIWSSILLDDVEINIFVNYEQFHSNTLLGGARPEMVEVSYNQYLHGMFRDISSVDDLQAFKNLQFDPDDSGVANIINQLGLASLSELTLDQVLTMDRGAIAFSTETFGMLRPSDNGSETVLDNNGDINNRIIWLTRANAKALGLMPGHDEDLAIDAEIAINSNALNNSAFWDFSRVYDYNATINPNKIDFLSVALHEIGHSLGFISGIDTADILYMQAENGERGIIQENELTHVSPMDLFRHSEASRDQGVFDWTSGTGRYFSLDGGVTNLANFAGGITANGDGYQTSHWEKQDQPLGIMTPTLDKGQAINISALDRQLMDILGWDVNLANLDAIFGNENQTQQARGGADALMGLPSAANQNAANNRFRWWMNFDGEADLTANNPVSVAEPNSAIAFLVFGILGLGLFRKRHS